MSSQVKYHAGIQKPNQLWVACGTFKSGKAQHGGITTVADFKTQPVEMQCAKCAAKIKQLGI